MKRYTAVIEKCSSSGLYVGYVPGMPGAHSQGKTLDELNRNLEEVLLLLQESGEADPESQFVGVHTITLED